MTTHELALYVLLPLLVGGGLVFSAWLLCEYVTFIKRYPRDSRD